MIKRVEELRPKLNAQTFPSKVFRQHQVPVIGSRAIEVVSRNISERTSWRDCICRRIQVDSLVRSIADNRFHGCTNQSGVDNGRDIRTVTGRSRVAVLVRWTQLNENRSTGLESGNT